MNKTFTHFLTVCFFALGAIFNIVQAQSSPFVTRWDLSKTGGANTELSFGVATSGTVNYTWQEVSPGTASGNGTFTGTPATITGLPANAIIDLSIGPANFQRIVINNGTNKSRLMQIKQWGSVAWTSMQYAFWGCNNMTLTATDVPNLTGVTNMSLMFRECSSFNQALPEGFSTAVVTDMSFMFFNCTAYNQALPSSFNTAAVTNMSFMFSNCTAYNQALPSSFNTAAVTNMGGMFSGCSAYNQALPSSFNTGAVTNMGSMFSGCSAYNQALPSSFNTAAVTTMQSMFLNCQAYNQILPSSFITAAVTNMNSMFFNCTTYNQVLPSSFNTAAVTNMLSMFSGCSAYNQALPSSFNTAAVTNMQSMFSGCIAYNQVLPASFNTGAVTNMGSMFSFCRAYNQALPSSFNTAAVTNMSSMFLACTAYNQALPGSFITAAVTNMQSMFSGCSAYNQALPSSFNVAAVTNMSNMFNSCTAFNQSLASWGSQLNASVNLNSFLNNCGMKRTNYDATLTAFAAGSATGRSMGASGLRYCNGETARNTLTAPVSSGGKGWTITGDSKNCTSAIYTTSTMTAFSACNNGAGLEQSFIIDGDALTADIKIKAPTSFEVSTTSGSGFVDSLFVTQNNGIIPSTTIYVRMKALSTGVSSGNIICSTASATRNLAVSGYTKPNISLNNISSVANTAIDFTIPYISTSTSPTQYSISSGSTNAMPSFVPVTNATLVSGYINVPIPASANGTYNFNLTVRNQGCESDVIPFQLTVRAPNPAAINLKGKGNSIAQNATSPSTNNYTDFGSIKVSAGTTTYTYTLENTGEMPLSLSGTPFVNITGAQASDFTVITQPVAASVAGKSSTNFTIVFDPSAAGIRTATVSIASNDASNNPYTFTIQGAGDDTPALNQYPYMVADIGSGVDYTVSAADIGQKFAAIGSKTYFTAGRAQSGFPDYQTALHRLWMTEGDNTVAITPESMHVIEYLNVNGTLFFVAQTAASGRELYKYDGTSITLFDIYVGAGSSSPTYLSNINGTIYFQAFNGTNGPELYKYDGTSTDPVLIDINVGANGSNPNSMIHVNNTLYFVANNGINGTELFKYDGTTVSVIDINVGSNGSEPLNLTNINGTLYFSARTTAYGIELYKYDGTTLSLIDINVGPGNSIPQNFINLNNILYFRANNEVSGTELFKYDGTTLSMIDINVGPDNSNPFYLANVNGTLYFSATTTANGIELYKYDGTSLSLIDINVGSGNSFPLNLTDVNGTLYFSASPSNNVNKLYKFNGTDSAPTLIEINEAGSILGNFRAVGSSLYFTTSSSSKGTELFKHDGTNLISFDINPGTANSSPRNLVNVNGTLYFQATTAASGLELWKSDGTIVGTKMVKDIGKKIGSSEPSNLFDINGTLYFVASSTTSGNELYKYDGMSYTLFDINPGSASSNPSNLFNANGTLYFTATTTTNGTELYKYDGTGSAPTLIDIDAGTSSSSPSDQTYFNGNIYFIASTSTSGRELYNYDGTNFSLIDDINTGSGGSNPSNLIVANGALYFLATTSSFGYSQKLFKYDGSYLSQITIPVPLSGSNNSISSLRLVGETIYFTATTDSSGTEPYKLVGDTPNLIDVIPGRIGSNLYAERFENVDGTYYFVPSIEDDIFKYDGNTSTKIDINPGPSGSNTLNLKNINGILYSNSTGSNGRFLTKYDGTTLTRVEYNSNNVGPVGFWNINGTLYFRDGTASNGVELYKYENNLLTLFDIYAGTGSSIPNSLTNLNGNIYFVADNGTSGQELFKTNGTLTGTSLLKDIWPNESSKPSNFLVSNNKLFFTAEYSPTDTTYGRELWSLGNCLPTNIAVSSAGTNVNYNSEQQASPTTQSCHCDVFNKLITTINATGASPVSGNINSKVWVEATQPAQYVKRHYEIAPATNASTATGRVTLYFTQQEFTDFNNQTPAPAKLLPTGVSNTAGIANLKIEKRSGVSSNGTGLPNTYSGAPEIIDPTDSDIVWNTSLSRWEVTFDATGFGGFFVIAPCVVPAAPSISGNTEICLGESVTLYANDTTSATSTHKWTNGLTGRNVEVSPLVTTSYRVAVTSDGCTSDSSAVFTITVNPKPVNPTISADNMSICKGGTAILTGTCSTVNAFFRWTTPQFINGNQTSALPSSNIRTVTEPGIYKGLCESDKGCLSAEVIITITEAANCNGQNFLTITPEKPVICPGTSIAMTASACTGMLSWLGGATTPTGTSVSLSPTATTTYLVNCSTGGSATFTIVVAANTLAVGQNVTTGKERFKAVTTLTSDKKVGSATFTPGANVIYEAGNSITLLPGFTAEKWSIFKAEIKTCQYVD